MNKFLTFLIIVSLAVCPVWFAVQPAFSQEAAVDPVGLGQEELFPPPPGDSQNAYDTDNEAPDSLLQDAYEEIAGEAETTSGNVAIEVDGDMPEEIKEVGNDLISLDLKGIEISEVFRILSMKIGKTVVASKGVAGRINLFLNNVTFEDALEVILITQGLACERKGNIIMIMRDTEYKKRYGKEYDEKRKLKSFKLEYASPLSVFDVLSKLKSDIGKIIVDEGTGNIILIDIPEKLTVMEMVMSDMDLPLTTQTFDLDYAEIDAMKSHLENMITDGPGKVYVDERTNKIIVSDLDEKVKDIAHMVETFDEESQQVFIEAMILQIALKEEFQRGINWAHLFSEGSGPFSLLNGLDMTTMLPAAPSFSPSPSLTGSNTTMTIGAMAVDDYTIALNFLETFGDTKVLSRPKIAVINKQEANILVGAREAYVTQSLSQGETTTVTSEAVSFIDVGVKLNVIPVINKDNFVTLQIKPEVSTVRETLATSLGSNIPIVETSEVSTTVKVKAGTTILIGGLMKEERRDDVSGFPYISRIPILGTFFSSRAKLKKTTEMIVFLRPSIMTGNENVILMKNTADEVIDLNMWPDEIKDEFIRRELEKIGAGISDEVIIELPTQPTISSENMAIQEKLKGVKDY